MEAKVIHEASHMLRVHHAAARQTHLLLEKVFLEEVPAAEVLAAAKLEVEVVAKSKHWAERTLN